MDELEQILQLLHGAGRDFSGRGTSGREAAAHLRHRGRLGAGRYQLCAQRCGERRPAAGGADEGGRCRVRSHPVPIDAQGEGVDGLLYPVQLEPLQLEAALETLSALSAAGKKVP